MQNINNEKLIWWTFLKIFFTLVLVVNFYFLYLGVNSDNQPIEEAAYDKGQKYQEEIDQQNNFNRIFKKPTIRISEGMLIVELIKLDGSPYSGADITAQILYSANQKYDRLLTLGEIENGKYAGNLNTKITGIWFVKLNLRLNDSELQYNQQVIN